MQGADGEQIWWTPPASVDLPDFVYRSADDAAAGPSKPIFHPKDVNRAGAHGNAGHLLLFAARAQSPTCACCSAAAILTEWYPQATQVESQATRVSRRCGTYAPVPDRMERREDPGARYATRCRWPADPQQGRRWRSLLHRARDGREFPAMSCAAGAQGPPSTSATCSIAVSGISRRRCRSVWMRTSSSVSLTAREAEQIDRRVRRDRAQGMMRYQKIEFRRHRARPRSIDPNTQPFGALRDVREAEPCRTWPAALVEQGLYRKGSARRW